MGDVLETNVEKIDALLPTVIRRLVKEGQKGEGTGLTIAQRMVLGILKNRGKVTMSDLSRKLGISMSATTTLVDRLEADGLVNRIRSESDRRVVYAGMTGAGQRVLQESKERRMQLLREFFSELDPGEVESFISVLEKMATRLNLENGSGCE